MTAGIAITGLFIALILGFQGVTWFFGRKHVGFSRAVGRGFHRVGKAAASLGLTLAVIGTTSWFLIPRLEWKRTANWLDEQREKGVEWIKQRFQKPDKAS